jgi:hypothetical protein
MWTTLLCVFWALRIILRREFYLYMFINPTEFCIYHIAVNTSVSYVVLIIQNLYLSACLMFNQHVKGNLEK